MREKEREQTTVVLTGGKRSNNMRYLLSDIFCIISLTLEASITTAADDKFCEIFPNYKKKGMVFHENHLPADDSHEISCLNL